MNAEPAASCPDNQVWYRRPRVWLGMMPLAMALAWLAIGPKPWQDGVEACKAAGQNVKVRHHMVTGLWYGTLLVLPAMMLLVPVAAKMKPLAPTTGPANRPVPSTARKSAWLPLAIGAAGLAIILARDTLPRLGQSLWDDEEKAMRFFTVGRCQPAKDGTMQFKPTTWTDVFFNYRQPNNHIFFTALSKASHDASGHKPDTPGAPYFNERALRLPAMIAGLAALAALAVSMHACGFPRAGLWAMPLLALHPWYLRYLAEARGYSLVILLGPLAMAAMFKALQSGYARWWTAVGILQFLLLWTYPGSLHFVIWLQLGAIAWLGFARDQHGQRLQGSLRWLATNLVSASAILVLMLPAIPQLQAYLTDHRDTLPFTAESARNLASLLFSGSTWHDWDATNRLSLGLYEHLESHPGLLAAAAVFALMLILGLIRWIRHGSLHAAMVPAMLFPALSFPLQAWITDHAFYPWYAIGALPFVLALAATGADALAHPFGRGKSGHAISLASGLVVVAVFALLTATQRGITTNHPIEPKRDSLKIYRGDAINPFDPRQNAILTVGFHQENSTYDPAVRMFDDVDNQAAFDAVLAEAESTGKPLFVDFAQEGYARQHFGHIFSRLDDPLRFERLAVLPGLEIQNTRVVMRYKANRNKQVP